MSHANLSIENQFSHAAFCLQIEQMNDDQARQMACFLHEQLLLQREAYQQMLATQWGMDNCQGINFRA